MKIQVELPQLVVFESALFRTCTSLILHDDHAVLVDPNWLPDEIEYIDIYIRRKAKDKKVYLFFTHSDYDHIIGYAKFKQFTSIASENFVLSDKKSQTLAQIHSFDDQYYIQRNYPIEYPDINIRVKQEKETIQLGQNNYHFHQALGHNADGLILHDPNNKVLIVGDYLSNIEFPYVYHSFKEYRNTLDRLEGIILEQSIDYLVTGHGDATNSKEEMHRRIKDSRSYIMEVEKSITQNKAFDFDQLMTQYKFPKIMRKFHEGNMTLAQSEFKSNT